MLETLLSTIAVMFAPSMVSGMSLPGGFIGSMVLGKLMVLGVIIVISIIANIVRALRYCRDKKGNFASTGISYGFQKGLTCGLFGLIVSTIVGFVPILRVPFTVIAFIPGMSEMVDGFIIAIGYLLSYMFIAFPIWGGSC